MKRISILEEWKVPAKNARGGTIEGQKRMVTRKEMQKFDVGGFMAQKRLWDIAKKRMLEDRGALPREDGDLLREYQEMHEENFLSSWLQEDVEGKEEEREKMNKEAKEEESRSGKREVEGERKRVEIDSKIICANRLSGKVFDVFCPVPEVERVGNSFDLSVCVPVCACCDCSFLECESGCEVVLFDSDCDFVEPQGFRVRDRDDY